ncbi:hypothetical protein FOL47_007044 [Perkinsus chesapeaki]|uniref:Uncharacterized protein n=1 Tax=Perkinsus chesapeaki TaxID=330153 RepID=A0A7J6LN66_PERCH|nr:hypothetical protein FOL47_007044 [Perkinsus chesapeaki]
MLGSSGWSLTIFTAPPPRVGVRPVEAPSHCSHVFVIFLAYIFKKDPFKVHQCAVIMHALTTAGSAEFEAMTLLNARILSELLEGTAIRDNPTNDEKENNEEGRNEGKARPADRLREASSRARPTRNGFDVYFLYGLLFDRPPRLCLGPHRPDIPVLLIARASGQSRMYDSQVLELVAGLLVSRISELNAVQLVGVLESYARLPRLRANRVEEDHRNAEGQQSTVSNSLKLTPRQVGGHWVVDSLISVWNILGFFAPPLLSALADELSIRLEDSDNNITATTVSRRKAVTPVEAHRFIVAAASVVDIEKASPELRESLRVCVDRLIKTCLFYTTTQLNSRGCLQLMAALKRLGNYDEKFINTRLLPTLNQHYMKGRSMSSSSSEEGIARVHEGVLIVECLAAIPQTTAMLARLRETIIYDIIEWISSTDLPSTDRSAREFLSIIARLMLSISEGEQSAAYELWEASRSKIARAFEKGLPLSDSELRRLLRICGRVDDSELADAISRSLAVKNDCAEALARDLVTRGGMREIKSPYRSVAELFTYKPLHGIGNMNVAVHETEAQVIYDLPNRGLKSSCEQTILRFSGAKIPLRTVLAQHVSTLESAPLKYLVNGRTVTECSDSPVDIRTFLLQSGFELIGDTGIQAPLWQGVSPQGVTVRICRLFNGRLDGQLLAEKGQAGWEIMRPVLNASTITTARPATLEEATRSEAETQDPQTSWSLVPHRCLVTIQASVPAVKGDANSDGGQSATKMGSSKTTSSVASSSKMGDGLQLLAVARHIERLADIVASEDYATSDVQDTSLEYL